MQTTSACQTTHVQIRFGTCPWCNVSLRQGQPAEQRSEKPFEGRWWNVARMMADLEEGDEQTRVHTAANLAEQPPGIEDALRLLRKALGDPVATVAELADQALCRLSQTVRVDDLWRYEAKLQEDPADLATVTLLLWVYFMDRSQSEAIRKSRRKLALEVIGAMPRTWVASSPLVSSSTDKGYLDHAKLLWLAPRRRKSANARLIGSAARFFSLIDGPKSEALFKVCKKVEPENPEWPWHLGFLYSVWKRHRPRPGTDWGVMSLAEYERVIATAPDSEWARRVLPDLANAAFDSGDYEKAHDYGERMLAQVPRLFGAWKIGRALHEGHTILGRVALVAGDLERAKTHLISAITPPRRSRLSSSAMARIRRSRRISWNAARTSACSSTSSSAQNTGNKAAANSRAGS